MRENIDSTINFFFGKINPEFITKIINNLGISKAIIQQSDIPKKIIKDYQKLFLMFYFCKL